MLYTLFYSLFCLLTLKLRSTAYLTIKKKELNQL